MLTTTLMALAASCPMLAGTYTNCVENPVDPELGTAKIVINQTVTNGVTMYLTEITDHRGEVTTEQLIADGQKRKVSEDGAPYTAMMAVSCPGNRVELKTEVYLNDKKAGDLRSEVRLQGSKIEITGFYYEGSSEHLAGTLTCQKTN